MEIRERLDALAKPFPRQAIQQRPGGGGKSLSYLETQTVIRRLNECEPEWSWEVISSDWKGELFVVLGRLTIPGIGSRCAYGVQKVSANGGEDLVKGASSDSLKKAATLFGVGLELYGPDYEAQSATQAPQQQNSSGDRERAVKNIRARIDALPEHKRDAVWGFCGDNNYPKPFDSMTGDQYQSLRRFVDGIAAPAEGAAA